jgi:hypothetical protein
MSVGAIFFLIAAALFFLAGVGAVFFPGQVTIGLFFLALGLILAEYRFPWRSPP